MKYFLISFCYRPDGPTVYELVIAETFELAVEKLKRQYHVEELAEIENRTIV
jgi:hypothetical protein